MNLQEKELIEQARLMGIPAHEFAAQFITRDLVECTLTAVRKHVKLKENQEGQLIESLNADLKDLVSAAVVVIAAQGQSVVACNMKSYMGSGKTMRVVLDADGDDPQRHAITDRVNNRVLLVLAPDEYYGALDSNRPQKDQKDLELEEQRSAKDIAKSIEDLGNELLSTGLNTPVDGPLPTPYDLALEHVTNGGDITPKAIQTAAGVKRKDVADLILALAENGVISESDPDTGHRTLLNIAAPAGATSAENAPVQSGTDNPAGFTEDQYADAVLLVQKERRISLGFLKSNFQVTDEVAEQMIKQMEQDGVVSEENDMGGRQILD